jgi:ribosomal subunit interface protein
MNKINISGLNMSIGEELKSVIEQKFNKLFTHQSRIITASINISKSDGFTAKGHLELKGKNIILSAHSDNPFKAIDDLTNKLDRGLRRRARTERTKRKLTIENANK